MKKRIFLLLVLVLFIFAGCKDQPVIEDPLKDVSFSSVTIMYDGKPHSIFATGISEDYVVTYDGNNVFSVGNHEVTCVISLNGETKKVMTAYIQILEDELKDVTFSGISIVYDGELHSIYANGVPDKFSISYEGNGVIEVGNHEVKCIISLDGEVKKELKANIIITEDELKNVEFNDLVVTYDGQAHSIIAKNIPDGFIATYSGNNATLVGEYTITCIITKDEETVKTLTAKLTIVPINEDGVIEVYKIEFNDANFIYDGQVHSLAVSGSMDDYTVTYSGNDQTEVGLYEVTAQIKNSSGEVVATLKAMLTITDPNYTHYESE